MAVSVFVFVYENILLHSFVSNNSIVCLFLFFAAYLPTEELWLSQGHFMGPLHKQGLSHSRGSNVYLIGGEKPSAAQQIEIKKKRSLKNKVRLITTEVRSSDYLYFAFDIDFLSDFRCYHRPNYFCLSVFTSWPRGYKTFFHAQLS